MRGSGPARGAARSTHGLTPHNAVSCAVRGLLFDARRGPGYTDSMGGLTYSGAGVDTSEAARATAALARVLQRTMAHRPAGTAGASVLEHGYYASALRITDDLALGLCTDGVGSKLLVAEMLGKYDTVGIDCIAMNVNDLVCIGAEPIALVDYVGVEKLSEAVMEQVAEGLAEGARQARISIPGGETAQLPDIIRGQAPGTGLDLVGTAVGLVPMDRLSSGKDVAPGDVVIGVKSSGVHSNGLTLARRALFGKDAGGLAADSHVDELGCTAGEALLEPTRIYVREALALFESGLPWKALCHITGDGLLNLDRVEADVGFVLDALPPAPPVFDVIRRSGKIDTAEMYTVFNMGVGLCVIVAEEDVDETLRLFGDGDAFVLGRVTADEPGTVVLPGPGLAGKGTAFVKG